MPQPRLSVVTISYNQARFLEEAIRSVVSQKNGQVEYIVVDPGSRDGSRQIIEKYSDQIDHIVLELDSGPPDGLNNGFSKATGEVLAYLNADDCFLPGAFETMLQFFEKHPHYDVVSGNGYRIDAQGDIIRRIYSTRFSRRLYGYGGCQNIQQATFFKREVFERTNGFNVENRTCWDTELLVDMALQGARFGSIHSRIASFRIHGESITGRYNEAELAAYEQDRARILEKVLGRPYQKMDRVIRTPVAKVFKWLSHPLLFCDSLCYWLKDRVVLRDHGTRAR